jgi:3-hydroxyisobutyrate dehydrogenase
VAEPARGVISPPAEVAFIGLGNMGEPMAARLVGAGYRVRGFDNSPETRERVAEATGVVAAGSLEEAVSGADAVVLMLPTGKVVRAVAEQMRGSLRPGTVIVDMSSSEPIGTRALGEELIAGGFEFVDAPVSGGVKRAVEGTLAIMVGGDDRSIDRVEPLLQAMGRSIIRTGSLGSGHAMKALNNYVSGAGLIAALEALEVGRAFGLDPDVIVDVFNASTGRNNSTEVKLKQFVISETYGSGFFLGLMAKDIRTAHALAEDLGVKVPLANRCADLWDEAVRNLGPNADHTEVYRALAGSGQVR